MYMESGIIKMAYIISLSNGKGGVAKTTSTLALGSSLAVMGYKVLLIDLDANANLTLGFGSFHEQPYGYSKDLFLLGNARDVKGVNTGFNNLDIIPSNKELSSFEGNTSFNGSASLLRNSLQTSFLGSYDFIVIDCPPTLGFLTTNALTASDLLIIPTQSEFFSAYALQTMFQLIGELRQKNNPNLKYRILITLLDLRLREHSTILHQLQKHLGDSLYKTTIQVDTHLKESQTQGVPITYSVPDSRGSLQYKNLAKEVIDDIKIEKREQITDKYAFSNIEPEDPDKSKSKAIELYCPFLGSLNDPQTMLTYPSIMNKCYRAKPILSPHFTHQASHCISDQYCSCPLLVNESKKRLPPDLRAPMGKAELLHYLKNLIRTKSN